MYILVLNDKSKYSPGCNVQVNIREPKSKDLTISDKAHTFFLKTKENRYWYCTCTYWYFLQILKNRRKSQLSYSCVAIASNSKFQAFRPNFGFTSTRYRQADTTQSCIQTKFTHLLDVTPDFGTAKCLTPFTPNSASKMAFRKFSA